MAAQDRSSPFKVIGPDGGPKKHPCPDCKMCQMCAETRCHICRGGDKGKNAFEGMSMAEQIEMYERLCAEERAAQEQG